MRNSKINNFNIKKKVLVAPLDWGLGHATRCIPIINELLAQGHKVFIGAEKAGAALLRNEFPNLQILPLGGYNISYSKSKKGFLIKLFSQIPAIKAAIKNEKRWLQNIITEYKIDVVISDNRYGLYNKNIYSIFITHQLYILTGNRLFNKIAQYLNYAYINKFDECWVPDNAEENNLGGILSHPSEFPKTAVKYIGIRSRFEKTDTEKINDIAIILSGPEPQRTIFENILIEQLKESKLKIVIARGLPLAKDKLHTNNDNIEIINHLPAAALSVLIQSSKIIVARSGYTTVIDLAVLQHKAIFVPTPGQTEQEYLAAYLAEKKYCISANQDELLIIQEIDKLNSIKLNPYPIGNITLLKKAIASLQ